MGALWIAECIDVVFVGYSVYHYTITYVGTYFSEVSSQLQRLLITGISETSSIS